MFGTKLGLLPPNAMNQVSSIASRNLKKLEFTQPTACVIEPPTMYDPVTYAAYCELMAYEIPRACAASFRNIRITVTITPNYAIHCSWSEYEQGDALHAFICGLIVGFAPGYVAGKQWMLEPKTSGICGVHP